MNIFRNKNKNIIISYFNLRRTIGGLGILLAMNSFFLFTLSDKTKDNIKRPKKIRNHIYRVSGIIMIALIIPGILMKTHPAVLESKKLVLIFEIVMLSAFGTSWIIKGETLFKDSRKIK